LRQRTPKSSQRLSRGYQPLSSHRTQSTMRPAVPHNAAPSTGRQASTICFSYRVIVYTSDTFNREALERFDPEAAKHFDELLEKAIEGKQRSR